MDMTKMDRIKVDDLKLRPEVFSVRLQRRARLRTAIDEAVKSAGGDALIDVTVEGYSQYWILFSRNVTRVEGVGIRFNK